MKKKIDGLAKEIKKEGLDAFFSGDPFEINYLTGLENSQGWLIFTSRKEMVYFTAPIQAQAFKKRSNLKMITCSSGFFPAVAKEAKKIKLKNIGFSKRKISLDSYYKLKKELTEKKINLTESPPLIENLKKIKTSQEISLIKKAASVSREAFNYISAISAQTMSEKDLSIEAERFLRLKGDNQTAFPAIIAADKNTFFAHHSPKNTKINNFFLADLGAKQHGYCSDLTRMFFFGKMPPLVKTAYEIIKKAQSAAIKKVKCGRKASEVDKAARTVINKAGFSKYFLHGLGHGIGLQVHEPPYLKPKSNEILKEGMVITIEPAIYYKSKFGVRLEEMVVVKSKKGEVIS